MPIAHIKDPAGDNNLIVAYALLSVTPTVVQLYYPPAVGINDYIIEVEYTAGIHVNPYG